MLPEAATCSHILMMPQEFILFADADAEEIGKAVIESFIESERYYNMG